MDRDRAFRLHHREYDADRIDGFDYDIGAALVRVATADNEADLIQGSLLSRAPSCPSEVSGIPAA
ncbi:hypothetical protein ACFVH6_08275 [Spirillospora sp. NPDC127200]